MPRFNLLLLVLLVGCVERVVVRAPVYYPAELPVRAFPSLVVAGGDLPEGDLGERLRAHLLADKQHEVRKVEVKELEPLRKAGGIAPSTLVILLEAGFGTDGADEWQLQPVQVCDPFYGCYTDFQNVYGAGQRVIAEVDVTVYEGPTARKLQTLTLDAWAYGADTAPLRQHLISQLGAKLERAVDVLKSDVQAELEPVRELPIVGLALAQLRAGHWSEGRDLLEQAARQLGGQKRKVQKRVWYDLGLARLYAPGPAGLDAQAFAGVERALTLAIELDGTKRYLRAYQRAKQMRERAQILEDQRRAARANYALRANSAP
ncbi:MAG TPA: hypothetical protein VFX59_00055 [Polyangiales bacterium]|nr:hypothetical protein [Polyangiales bacterium]